MIERDDEDKYKILRASWQPSKIYKITLEESKFSLKEDGSDLYEMMHLSGRIANAFMDEYKDTHAFTDPQLSYKPNGLFTISIGTLENEQYEKLVNDSK